MPFKPGQSGNPNGRPKENAEVKALARLWTEEAITTLAEVMRDKTAPPSARVMASSTILDRGWGKALQNLDVNIKHSFVDLLKVIESERRAASDRAVGTGVDRVGEQPAEIRH